MLPHFGEKSPKNNNLVAVEHSGSSVFVQQWLSGYFSPLKFLSSLWQFKTRTTCHLQICSSSTTKVTQQQTFSYLRPISRSSVSSRWVHVSRCATVKLLWLDAALSYLLLYFSPTSVPIDRTGIILHISTYCGRGCGNKRLTVDGTVLEVSLCGARPRVWGESGRVVKGRIARGIEQIIKYVNTSKRGRGEKWTGK